MSCDVKNDQQKQQQEQQQQSTTKPPVVVVELYEDGDIFVQTTEPSSTTTPQQSINDDNNNKEVNTSIASGCSTLSDGCINNNDDSIITRVEEEEEVQQQQHMFVPRSRISIEQLKEGGRNNINSPNRMARPNSQLSTDNESYATRNSMGATSSSRDASGNWGWFEDVHGIGGGGGGSSTMTMADGLQKNPMMMTTSSCIEHQAGGISNGIIDDTMNNNNTSSSAVTAPTYVLEESLSSQRLWKDTAGNRPPQPVEERAFYEKMWAQNFARSQVDYQAPIEVLTASSPVSLSPFADGGCGYGDDGCDGGGGGDGARGHHHHGGGVGGPHGVSYSDHHHHYGGSALMTTKRGDLYGATNNDMAEAAALMYRLQDTTATRSNGAMADYSGKRKLIKRSDSEGDIFEILKGDNVFGTTVSKSFPRSNEYGAPISGVDTITISIASYRVVESKKIGKYAQFLVIYRDGSIRDTVGVWKRFSDFVDLSKKVTSSQEGCSTLLTTISPLHITEEHEHEHLPNAITSWSLIKKRQKWHRCLAPGYLSLKVFLLERFLHDILFECSTPTLLRAFALDQ